MRKLLYFLRQYKFELIGLIINAATLICSYVFIGVLGLYLALAVFAASFFVIVYLRNQDREFYFFPMDDFNSRKDWVGSGNFDYVRNCNCFEITNSGAGYICPKILAWDDYVFQCDFKIVRASIGWIVRSVNLSNYIMFQCFSDGIKPHVRVNGEWLVIQPVDAGFVFDNKLSIDKWYTVKIFCEKRVIRLVILDKKATIFDRSFTIPPQVTTKLSGETEKKDITIVQNIDLDFGAAGFRNHGHELGYFKNVYFEKL